MATSLLFPSSIITPITRFVKETLIEWEDVEQSYYDLIIELRFKKIGKQMRTIQKDIVKRRGMTIV